MIRNFTTFILVICAIGLGSAQDHEFTQFYASPLTLNPALTGAFAGKYRLSMIYRDQWRGALEQPYKTFAAAIDLRFRANSSNVYKDQIGAGIVFFTDKVNVLEFGTNQIAFSLAYHKALDTRKKHVLSAGIQFGIAQRNLNLDGLTFDDQFNGLTGFTNNTAEEFPENNFSYADMSFGLNYAVDLGGGAELYSGLSMFHFAEPDVSFYQQEDPPLESKLHRKISAQVSATLPIASGIQLIPRAQFSAQGPHQQLNLGSNIRLARSGFGEFAFHFGGWVRPVKSLNSSFDLNSLIVFAGFELHNFLLGLSYDVNLDDVVNYQQGQNTFEISFAYLGEYENETILCPKF